jgi:hypothetical protein
VVECDLAKVEVAGSNPVSRSRSSKAPRVGWSFSYLQADLERRLAGGLFIRISLIYCLGRGTQVVRERSAKPLYVSSILTRASKFSLLLVHEALTFVQEFSQLRLASLGFFLPIGNDPRRWRCADPLARQFFHRLNGAKSLYLSFLPGHRNHLAIASRRRTCNMQ